MPIKITMARTVGYLIAAGALLIGAVMLYSSAVRADTGGPALSGISSSFATSTATVAWTTDQAATSQIAYGTSLPYTASTTLNTVTTTSHSVVLSGLSPNTTYHYQVLSANDMGSTTMSADQTFMTNPLGPATLSLSQTSGTPGTAVTITGSGFRASEDVGLNVGGAMSSTTTNGTGGFTAAFTAPTTTGSTTITATGAVSGLVATGTFLTQTATSTSSDLTTLQQDVALLKSQVATLQQQVAMLLGQSGGNNGTTGTSTNSGLCTTSTSGSGTIDQNGSSVRAGTSIDFGGHNFGCEEHVNVMLNGLQVSSGFTNRAGGFSTGSMSVPQTPGTYTYSFRGANSNITATAVITVTR